MLKKAIGILVLALSSAVWIIVSYRVFVEEYYSFREMLHVMPPEEIFLPFMVWLLMVVITTSLCWFTMKRISKEYRFHFFHWLFVMLLFTYPFVQNRGHYWFLIGLFYGVPAIGLNYLINGFRTVNFHRFKVVNRLIFFAVFLFGGYGEFEASSSADFENTEFEFEVNTYTIPTFLDWQVEAEIEIWDKRTDKEYEFEFWFGEGPIFDICKDIYSDSTLYLYGRGPNSGHNWTINFNQMTIQQGAPRTENGNVEVIAVHDVDFN